MKVWIIIKEESTCYEPYPEVTKVFDSEEKANIYIRAHNMYSDHDVEEWDVE